MLIACAGREEDANEQHKRGVDVSCNVTPFGVTSQIVVCLNG